MTDVNQTSVAFVGARARLGATNIGPIDLTVEPRETVVLLGASGAGKTTLLRLANALIVPASGEVRVDGVSTTAWDPVRLRRRMGYVIQEVGLFPHMTVARNVGIVPQLEAWPPHRIAARTMDLLALVGLDATAFGRRYPHELSGGQRQRVGVARALAADPPMLLCDEPFGALDPVTRVELQREFKALVRRLGKTVLFVTHDVREALVVGDRIVVLETGRIRFSGTPDAFRGAADPVVRRLREAVA